MQIKHWQASGQPQARSRKTPKVVRRQKRALARLAQKLRLRPKG
ncbi:hypothetical protein RIF25_13570 [Thermosynechococcaceae cyanobacterium BACA0444]|uniref:Uncharacterized protein n=1 Tax=Pseudocalidococcus azoricus BACA0444 TaxID=2918990 RepID=A0AAE4FTZ1_9CYAN|nr:hypothetical protein [Pseudocalidococcus azoricus]MDS3861833.1 hypothetical protein [Pseudocalidococcus azoricus BACA0444]